MNNQVVVVNSIKESNCLQDKLEEHVCRKLHEGFRGTSFNLYILWVISTRAVTWSGQFMSVCPLNDKETVPVG
jgi:hypothetical protein